MCEDNDWCEDFDNVLKLARWLVGNGHIETATEAVDYFAAPWKWRKEFMQIAEKTDY